MQSKAPLPDKPHCHQMRKHELPSAAEIRKRFSYEPITGIIRGPQRRPLGTKGKPYARTSMPFKGQRIGLSLHRIAFAIMEGRWPHLIDHINGDKNDNSWRNLREVSSRENAATNGSRIYKTPKGFGLTIGCRGFANATPCRLWQHRIKCEAALAAGKPLPDLPKSKNRTSAKRKAALAAMRWRRPL